MRSLSPSGLSNLAYSILLQRDFSNQEKHERLNGTHNYNGISGHLKNVTILMQIVCLS